MSISPPPTKRRRLETSAKTVTLDSKAFQLNHLSIYSWNINGIQPFIQKSITSFFQPKTNPSASTTKEPQIPHTSLRDFLRRNNWPTLLFLQEVKINPSDTQTKKAVEAAVRSPNPSEPSYTAHFCLPTDPHNARGFGRKVYGVCTLIREDFKTQTQCVTRTVDWDREGRILIHETTRGRKLSLWNIYAVNGTSNPWKHSRTGEVIGTRHDRKLRFHEFMLEECLRLQIQGYEVVLAGDMNIARSILDGHPNLRTTPEEHVRNRKDFNKKFFEDEEGGFGGVDTYRHVCGDRRGYTYYPRGKVWGSSCDRVDLIICSAGLKEAVLDAGILETPADRGPSDHVPLFATFDLGKSADVEDEDET